MRKPISPRMKMYYIFLLGFLVGGIFQTILININAEAHELCDIEVFVFAMNNDIEKLESCIQAENELQDARMDIVERRVDLIENTRFNNTDIDIEVSE